MSTASPITNIEDFGVEGSWGDGYHFRVASISDRAPISAFLSLYYYRDEPITHLLTGWSAEKEADTDAAVVSFLPHNLSIIATIPSSSSGSGEEIVGVRIAYDSRRTSSLSSLISSEDNRRVGRLKDSLEEMAKGRLEAEFPEGWWAQGFLASVADSHRGRGLASQLYIRSLNHFQRAGFRITRNFFSSEVTRGIVKRLGYVELSRMPLREVKDEAGRPTVFPGAEISATFMAKRLLPLTSPSG